LTYFRTKKGRYRCARCGRWQEYDMSPTMREWLESWHAVGGPPCTRRKCQKAAEEGREALLVIQRAAGVEDDGG